VRPYYIRTRHESDDPEQMPAGHREVWACWLDGRETDLRYDHVLYDAGGEAREQWISSDTVWSFETAERGQRR